MRRLIRVRHPHSAHDSLVIVYPLENNQTCAHCSSIEIDHFLRRHFNIFVCSSCRELHANCYSLLTKTTAKEEYLLTDEELADTSILPFMTKPNPYKSSWSDMHLYLAMHVRDYALKKWGSLEALQQELEHRSQAKECRKEKHFKQKLHGTAHPLPPLDL